MKSLSLGIVRASASSALAYSRLYSGKPDRAELARRGNVIIIFYNDSKEKIN
ncbi:MAG: hypothetical protein LBQ31_07485 [Bacteroidales bacterium]|nr:hypothetical protein [Bacteroidales bacterium]